MKVTLTLLLAVLVVSAVLTSGCVQQTTPSGVTPGELSEDQKTEQAYQAVEDEMDEALDNMTLEEVENELLQQG